MTLLNSTLLNRQRLSFLFLAFLLCGFQSINSQITNRAQALSDYQNNYAPANVTASVLNWTGNTANCSAGTISSTAKNRYLQRVNYYRRLVGVSDNVTFNTTLNAKCQKAALMMDANSALSHQPPSSWNCYSNDGAEAAGSGNLAGPGTTNPIDAYIHDFGSNNAPVGHRRWILYSKATQFGIGNTNNYNSMWVFQANPSSSIYNKHIAYPPEGYIPNTLVYPRWSFGIPNANFNSATVTVKDQNNNSLPVSIVNRAGPNFGDNTLVFVPSNIITNSANDISYTVTVSNISGAPSSSYTYTTTLFSPVENTCTPPTTAQNTTSSITTSTARLNTSSSGNNYEWRYRKSTISTWTTLSRNSLKNRTISGLSAGTAYIWQNRRRCTNNVWSTWSANESFTTTAAATCSRPSTAQNTTSSITTSTARLNTSSSGNNYEWRYRKSTISTWTTLSRNSLKNRTISGLSAGTAYIWQNRRRCTNNVWSTWSANESFTTTAAATCSRPSTAQNTTSSVTTSTARLNTSSSGNNYEWRYRKSTISTWTTLSQNSLKNRTISGLSAGTAYIWQNRRRCTNNVWSTWSANESFTTTVAATCSSPTTTQNTTSSITSTSAKLNTSAAGTSFHWQYKKSTSNGWITGPVTAANNHTIVGLTSNTTYNWRSARRCTNGIWSTWSSNENFTTSTEPPPPTPTCTRPTTAQNTTSSITTSNARLNTSSSGNNYEWRYRKNTVNTWTTLSRNSLKNRPISGLSAGTAYIWQNRRRCTNNVWSTWSANESFTTSVAATCSSPTASQNTTTSVTTSSAKMNTSASGISYDWRYKVSTSASWINRNNTTANNSTLSNLVANTTYHWQSARRCSNGIWSSWSATKTFATLPSPCTSPTSTQNYTSSVTSSSASLNTTSSGTHYDWRYRKSTENTWTDVNTTLAKVKVISSLSSSSIYYWQSRRRCSTGVWSAWSANETFITSGSTCPDISAGSNYTKYITPTSARFYTSNSGNLYDWRYRKSSTSTWTNVDYTSSSQFQASNLSPSTNYIWQSRKRCTNFVWSSWSPNATFATGATNCYVPSDHQNTTSYIRSNSARLNTTNTTGLEYEWRYGEGLDESYDRTIKSTNRYLTITGLRSNLYHSWSMRIRCSNGWSAWSNRETFRTLQAGNLTSSETRDNMVVESEEVLLTDEMVKVFPNPASNHVVISTGENFKASLDITLYDSKGAIIRNFSKVSANNLKLDISSFAPGAYYLRLSDSQSILTKKLIINR